MTDREKRREPFVGWMSEDALNGVGNGRSFRVYQVEQIDVDSIPVVMTPLLPDDPKPGETWLVDGWTDPEVTVQSAPWDNNGHRMVATTQGVVRASTLHRPPKLKTYRLAMGDLPSLVTRPGFRDFQAESIDDALAKIRASLTEVTK